MLGIRKNVFFLYCVNIQFCIIDYSKDLEGNESESFVCVWSGDVLVDFCFVVIVNDDCILKFYVFKGMKNI